jgi:GNAT superfamily N-acetyltransferase
VTDDTADAGNAPDACGTRILIRPAKDSDAAGIAAVHMASRAATMPYLPPQRRGQEEVTGWIKDVVLPACLTWVAERVRDDHDDGGDGDDGCDAHNRGTETELVGYAALDGDLLEHLYLRPDVRRQGIGTLLLEEAKLHSPGGLSLHVFQQNTDARAFYAHHGFTVLDTDPGDRNMENLPDMTLRWAP